MTQNLADFSERGLPAQHLAGQGMAQLVRSLDRRIEAGALESPSDDRAHGRDVAELSIGSLGAEKHMPSRAARTSMTKVGRQGLTDILEDGKSILPAALASDRELPSTPVEILQAQCRNLSGPQPEPCKEQEHGVVAQFQGAASIASR